MTATVKLSKFDKVYRRLLLSKFFTKGFGDPENIQRLFQLRDTFACREKCCKLINPNHSVKMEKEFIKNDLKYIEGSFASPLESVLPGLLPAESVLARFEAVLPRKWESESAKLRPMCVHLAGTGDHYFWRRRVQMAKPLAQEHSIGSIMLENPFYGSRKPVSQTRSQLRNVTDLFVMGAALMLETSVLLYWALGQGLGPPLGVSGVSMGGHMAALAATVWPRPLSLVPCLSAVTASHVFTQGVLGGAVPWRLLAEQFQAVPAYHRFFHGQHQTVEHQSAAAAAVAGDSGAHSTSAYERGRSFARDFPRSGSAAPPKFLSVPHPSVEFMRGLLDEFTYLANFDRPVDPALGVVVSATQDAYILAGDTRTFQNVWPEVETRYVHAGHVQAALLAQRTFRQAVVDSFDRQINRYYS